jgi:xylose isomerase
MNLASLRDLAASEHKPVRASGKQEWYENVINQYL